MKNIWATIIASLLCAGTAEAQSLGEWIRPKKKQKEYLIQQVLANQSLVYALRTGYRVAQYGLQTVWLGKNHELRLHQYFFDVLKTINPKVLEYGRVADFIVKQSRLIRLARKHEQDLRQQRGLNGEQLGYVDRVYDRMRRSAEDLLWELLITILADDLALTDDQRIGRIDALYNEMEVLERAFSRFSMDQQGLVQARKRAQRERLTIQDWYGVKGGDDER